MVLAGVVILAGLAWLAAPGQLAAANGVHFDPDSPAGKEYALPLDEARDEVTGGFGSDRAAGESAPLFGVGVSARGSGDERTVKPEGAKAGQEDSRGAKPPRGRESTEGTGSRMDLAAAGGGYAMTTGAAMVAAIVLLGCGLGVALRALQRVSAH